MTPWRSYAVTMAAAEQQVEQRSNGFICEWRGARTALAFHEAGHFAAAFALGGHVADVVLRAHYSRGDCGDLLTEYDGYHGKWRADGHPFDATALSTIPDAPPGPGDFLFPFGMKLRAAIIACAGPASEWKYRAANGLAQSAKHSAKGDRSDLADYARIEQNGSGANPEGFLEYAWCKAQELTDAPVVNRAVEALGNALVTGIGAAAPENPQPGETTEFMMTAAQAEALMTKAGLQHGMFALLHRRVAEGYGAVHDASAKVAALAHGTSMGGSL